MSYIARLKMKKKNIQKGKNQNKLMTSGFKKEKKSMCMLVCGYTYMKVLVPFKGKRQRIPKLPEGLRSNQYAPNCWTISSVHFIFKRLLHPHTPFLKQGLWNPGSPWTTGAINDSHELLILLPLPAGCWIICQYWCSAEIQPRASCVQAHEQHYQSLTYQACKFMQLLW